MAAPTGATALNPVPAAALFAAIAGLLSVRYPYFDGLTAALAALLLVAWGSARSRPRGRWSGPVPPVVGALALAAAGWGVFFLTPPSLAEVRGLVLGAAVLPLWLGFEPGSLATTTAGGS